jgi:hypothetical protein
MFSLLRSGYGQRLLYISQFQTDRKHTEELIKFWLDLWRDVMLVKCHCIHNIVNIDQLSILEAWAKAITLSEIINFVNHLQASLVKIALNANPQLTLECLLLNMPIRNLFSDQGIHKSN